MPPFKPTVTLPVLRVDALISDERLFSTMFPTVTLLPLKVSVPPALTTKLALLPIWLGPASWRFTNELSDTTMALVATAPDDLLKTIWAPGSHSKKVNGPENVFPVEPENSISLRF